jgi:sigma-B regulation protein RsbU (phosphoserine phosphatase)
MDKRLKVILIEDSPSDAQLVQVHLRRSELNCTVDHAESLGQGTTLLNESDYDVALLDLTLPDSTGIATFRSLHEGWPHLPIVVLSGQSDNELAITAVREGAQDYLPKSEFSSSSLARSIRYAVERHDREIAQHRVRELEQDAQAAASVQQQLLPQNVPLLPGLDIAAACVPAAATGGDFYDFLTLPDGRLGVLIADVSGHGLGPAMIMASARRVIRSLRVYHADLGELFTAANHDILEDTGAMHFVTAFLAAIDPEKRSLEFTSAGHESWLMTHSGKILALNTEGLPLGIVQDHQYPSSPQRTLQPGEILVLLTDGIAEAQRPDRSLFTTARVQETLTKLRDHSAEAIVRETLRAATEFCKPAAPHDDMTIVVIKIVNE